MTPEDRLFLVELYGDPYALFYREDMADRFVWNLATELLSGADKDEVIRFVEEGAAVFHDEISIKDVVELLDDSLEEFDDIMSRSDIPEEIENLIRGEINRSNKARKLFGA